MSEKPAELMVIDLALSLKLTLETLQEKPWYGRIKTARWQLRQQLRKYELWKQEREK